jgi:hypothetical protein
MDARSSSTLRTVGAVIAGALAWPVGFFALGMAFGLLWPAYREAVRVLFAQQDFSHFTPPMVFANFGVFIGCGLISGWLAASIARNRAASLGVTLLYLAVFMVDHYIFAWNILPAWYNVIVPFIIAAPIFVGGRLARASATRTAASNAVARSPA